MKNPSAVQVDDTLDDNLGKFLQRQNRLAPIIHSPPLLGIRFDYPLSTEERLVSLLEQIEGFFYQALSVWAERRLNQQLHSIPSAELLHPGAGKFPAFVCDDFAGKPLGGPLLRLDFDTVFPAEVHLAAGRVFQTGHDRPLSALITNIDSGNQLGSGINRHINLRPAHDAAPVQAGHQVKVSLGGVHLVAPRTFPPAGCRTKRRAAIPLIVGETVTGNDFLWPLVVIMGVEVVLEAGPGRCIRQQDALGIRVFLNQHHFISPTEGELFCGKVESANCPIVDLVFRWFPPSLLHEFSSGEIAVIEPEDSPGSGAIPPGGLFGKG